MNFRKKLQHNFPKMSGGGVKGRLELFRKFIRFGRGMRPLLETAMERRGGPGGCIAQFLVTLVALDPTHVSQWPTVNG